MIDRLTVASLAAPPGYSHASVVAAGTRLAFLAGAVPLDRDGALVGPGDVVAQTDQVLRNLTKQLSTAGSDLAHVLMSTVHVVSDDPAVLGAVWDVVADSGLSAGPHSATLVGWPAWATPGSSSR